MFMNTRGTMFIISFLMTLAIQYGADARPDSSPPLPPWEYEEDAVRLGSQDYSLTGTSYSWHGPSNVWADDVHRTGDDPMTGLVFAYRSTAPNPDLTLDLWIYANDADNELMPTTPLWHASYDDLVTSPSDGVEIDVRRFFEFDAALAAPRDLWIAYRFSNQLPHEAGALLPTRNYQFVGWSSCLVLLDTNGDLVPELPYCHAFEFPGFLIETYSQPLTPSPASGSVLLVAAVFGRRRRRAET